MDSFLIAWEKGCPRCRRIVFYQYAHLRVIHFYLDMCLNNITVE